MDPLHTKKSDNASTSPTSSGPASAVPRPRALKTSRRASSSYDVGVVLVIHFTTSFGLTSYPIMTTSKKFEFEHSTNSRRIDTTRMATKCSQNRGRWPLMTMLLLLFVTLLLPEVGLGQVPQSCLNGNTCPQGYCCAYNGSCGITPEYCGDGNCSSQCSPGNYRCGVNFSGEQCPPTYCCSNYGWCGNQDEWCGEGVCQSQCTSGPCGFKTGLVCRSDYCCSNQGACGNTTSHCDATTCSSQCGPLSSSPSPDPPPTVLSPTLAPQNRVPLGQSPAPGPAPTVLSPVLAPQNPAPLGHKSGGNKVGTIVEISMSILAFLIACIIIAALVVRRQSGGRGRLWWASSLQEYQVVQVQGMPETFSYKQLSIATKAFCQESKLGQGGFGSVYSGVLPSSGIAVAVKKISSDSSQGEREFMAEVSIISQLRHRNLIQLQGWCKDASRGNYLLVYELMPNGSLDKMLFMPAESQTPCLSWPQRFNIVTGAAAALDYLHQGWKQQVIHRDIKSSNIMLDEEWTAKLGDFGLARLVDHGRAPNTTGMVGTYGYIAPEIATSGRFTDKTDVYAFGATLLEIACGRQAFSSEFPPNEILVDWVWKSLSEGGLLSTVDKRLEDYDPEGVELVLMVGLLCSHPDPLARPSMRHVVEVLAGDVPVPPVPASKPTPVFIWDSQTVFVNPFYTPNSRKASKARSE